MAPLGEPPVIINKVAQKHFEGSSGVALQKQQLLLKNSQKYWEKTWTGGSLVL